MFKKFREYVEQQNFGSNMAGQVAQKASAIIQKATSAQNPQQIDAAKKELEKLEKDQTVMKATDIKNKAVGAQTGQAAQGRVAPAMMKKMKK